MLLQHKTRFSELKDCVSTAAILHFLVYLSGSIKNILESWVPWAAWLQGVGEAGTHALGRWKQVPRGASPPAAEQPQQLAAPTAPRGALGRISSHPRPKVHDPCHLPPGTGPTAPVHSWHGRPCLCGPFLSLPRKHASTGKGPAREGGGWVQASPTLSPATHYTGPRRDAGLLRGPRDAGLRNMGANVPGTDHGLQERQAPVLTAHL